MKTIISLFIFISLSIFIISCETDPNIADCAYNGETTCSKWQYCDSDSGDCKLKYDRCNKTEDCKADQYCDQSHSCIDINQCVNINCSDRGRCVNSEDGPFCICDVGYKADNLSCIELE